MKRNVDLNEITDGRFYGLNDLVRAGCQNCTGCSKCCHEMVDTILLDPLDVFRLNRALRTSFDELLRLMKIKYGGWHYPAKPKSPGRYRLLRFPKQRGALHGAQ